LELLCLYVMAKGLWEKIEEIRQQPEHVRMRYVFGCLFISMLFIFGIWILSLGESFRNISKDVPGVVENGKKMLPNEQIPSLDDLLQKATPLQPESQSTTGGDYFNNQAQNKTQNTGANVQTTP